MPISWLCFDGVSSIDKCSFSCLISFWELKLIENESSLGNIFRFVVSGDKIVKCEEDDDEQVNVGKDDDRHGGWDE